MSQQPIGVSSATATEEFVKLLLAHQTQIHSFIFTLLPNWTEADEVFQETGLVLWQKFGEFRRETNFAAWACQIARHKVMNRRKKAARSPLRFDDAFLKTVSDERLAQVDLWSERRVALIRCRDKLPPKDRAILDHCYQDGITIKGVAEDMGRPVDSLYKALKRIRGVLHECIRRSMAREEQP